MHRRPDRRVADDEDARAGSNGSRNTSIAPPDRHGFWIVVAPSSSDASRPTPSSSRADPSGSIRSNSASRSIASREYARTLSCAHAAHEALDRAVLQHERDVARLHARRALRANDRGDHERRAPRCEPRARVDTAPMVTGAARPSCIAAQTRAGVQGMSMWSTPWVECSASMTAFTIAGDPTVGDSPTPLPRAGDAGRASPSRRARSRDTRARSG